MPLALKNKVKEVLNNYRSLPDFLVIGVQKGGTSSLHGYLKEHPKLRMSAKKEIHYFDLNYTLGEKWYRSHFPLKKRWLSKKIGETTPYYFYHPHVPKRVFQLIPNVKLIVLLRNPIDRAFSLYRAHKYFNTETYTFEEAIQKEKERIEPELQKMLKDPYYLSPIHQKYSYLARGLYYKQFLAWFKYFDRSQFLILKSETFYTETAYVLEKIYDFLEVKGQPISKNRGYEVINKGKLKESMLPKTRASLVDFYQPHNEKLYNLLGVNFHW